MILSSYIVWRNKKPVQISKIEVGNKIAVLAEDKTIAQATVKSIIPVFSASSMISHSGGPVLYLAKNSTILTEAGFLHPVLGDLIISGIHSFRVNSVKDSLQLRQFYDIMIDVDLPVILQDGFCIKVKCRK